jgi:hypothetical protein
MGLPDDYDWGLTPEKIEDLKADMVISVSVTLDRGTMDAIREVTDGR